MRKVLLAFAATLTVGGWAQVFNVASLVPVALPPDVGSKVVAISGQGDFLLLTADDNSGLTKLDLSTGKAQNITRAAGAGYDARVSPDGKRVVYRENSFTSGHLRMVSLRSINLGSGQSRELVAPTRNLQGVGINNQAALPVTRGQVTAKGFELAIFRPMVKIKVIFGHHFRPTELRFCITWEQKGHLFATSMAAT